MDGEIDAGAPEALVYEPRGERWRLVAVEYVVPQGLWGATPPTLFGQTFHEVSVGGNKLWVLHAWVWRDNPAGTFADFNVNVGDCPTSS